MAAKKNSFDGYIDQVGEMFAKLPTMPKGGREFFVMILPWLALIFGILGIWRAIRNFSFFSFFSPYMYPGGADLVGGGMIAIVLGVVSAVLLLMAFSGLNKQKAKGWKFIYLSLVVAIVLSLIIFSIEGILLTLVGFYILYQVRSYYK